jgi:hypothetical protein
MRKCATSSRRGNTKRANDEQTQLAHEYMRMAETFSLSFSPLRLHWRQSVFYETQLRDHGFTDKFL